MKVKGIIMQPESVRAILREIERPGTGKTQTRRILKPQPSADHALTLSAVNNGSAIFRNDAHGLRQDIPLPYAPGDLLWVREAWASDGMGGLRYYATHDVHELRRKRSPIHMPRWASRLTLSVEAVKVQRLQDISEEDAQAEGVWHSSPEYREQVCIWRDAPSKLQRLRIEHFAKLWDTINGKRPGCAWSDNPFVVAVTFRCHLENIDAFQSGRSAA